MKPQMSGFGCHGRLSFRRGGSHFVAVGVMCWALSLVAGEATPDFGGLLRLAMSWVSFGADGVGTPPLEMGEYGKEGKRNICHGIFCIERQDSPQTLAQPMVCLSWRGGVSCVALRWQKPIKLALSTDALKRDCATRRDWRGCATGVGCCLEWE